MLAAAQAEISQLRQMTQSYEAALNDRARPILRLSDGQTFRGLTTEKPQAWINWLENYFNFNRVVGNYRTEFAVLLLRDAAAAWANSLPELLSPHLVDFDAFKRLFISRFSPIDAARQARMQLAQLRQDGPVQVYINTYQDLMAHITDMSESDRLHYFLQGLTRELHAQCLRSNVQTVVEASNLVIRLEAADNLVRATNSSFYSSRDSQHSSLTRQPFSSSSSSSFSSSPSPSSSLSSSLSSSSSLNQPMDIDPSIRQMQGAYTAEEVAELLLARNNYNRGMRERQKSVRCFKCNKLGHVQKNCYANNKSKNGEGQRRH